MIRHWTDIPAPVLELLKTGTVIPAHPLALGEGAQIDQVRQRALTRYYLDAGAGGLAVGVHTTQFEIRDHGLYAPVLDACARAAADWSDRPRVMIAGLVGRTEQAVTEARIARDLGYHAGLMSLAALKGASLDEMIAHCAAVAQEIPLFGFYLQPAVGGVPLPFEFWKRFAAIDNVIGVKMAPFNRYDTLNVLRGVAAARAEDRIALYTGNDDHIVADLLTPFTILRDDERVTLPIRGGLLGHWSVWTRSAVELHARCRAAAEAGTIPAELLALDAEVTDCNAALFDVANGFQGAIAGCHEVLRRQGLLTHTRCLSDHETLGPGQAQEITRVTRQHSHLTDDAFVADNLERWLA
ncbi:dihydrodipicolinate synthase family protein [Pseudooceanicola aestuarii]|uniref:dihydrodipicolinate synthase family protein n=1 Tax=Pseudooceanicola aestuarii TaxID=2697319 RepID=UPI0013D22881|nr:dihydrodipicolinate synthase family protein [Pseudooceanicola aestuarii]